MLLLYNICSEKEIAFSKEKKKKKKQKRICPIDFFFRPKHQPTCKIIEYKSANALSKRNEIKFAKKQLEEDQF